MTTSSQLVGRSSASSDVRGLLSSASLVRSTSLPFGLDGGDDCSVEPDECVVVAVVEVAAVDVVAVVEVVAIEDPRVRVAWGRAGTTNCTCRLRGFFADVGGGLTRT